MSTEGGNAATLVALPWPAQAYLHMLPVDWRDELLAMPDRAATATVYALQSAGELLCGGVVWHARHAGTSALEDAHATLFDANWHYIGFLWVPVHLRGRGHGARWLALLPAVHRAAGFWLTVESQGLIDFYRACGFALQSSDDGEEWLLQRACQ